MITLTHRAQQRLQVLHALDRGDLLTAQAAALLGLSTRQVRRLRAAYRIRGLAGLVHGNRGRPSPRRTPDRVRARLLRLAQTTYAGSNFQHLSELLVEREGLRLSRQTISRLLRAAGLRSPRRHRPPKHRRRRDRMARAGLLVQVDGSIHAWLDHRGPRLTLLAAMDDATGEVLAATFREEEDAHGYLLLFNTLTQIKGIPAAVYSDRHGIFHRTSKHAPTLHEQLMGERTPTQVGRALHELGIRWIPASSPQAKGRIERLFGTFQDRLRTELRVAGIRSSAGANGFLTSFVRRYNVRFAQRPTDATSAYRPWPAGLDPQTVFCFKYQRVVGNDNTVSLGPHHLQLLPGPGGRSYAKATVDVHERLDGSLAVFYHGGCLAHQMCPGSPPVRVPARPQRQRGGHQRRGTSVTTRPAADRLRTHTAIPAADHPWRHLLVGKTNSVTSAQGRTKSLNA